MATFNKTQPVQNTGTLGTVNVDAIPYYSCGCGGDIFSSGIKFKKISSLITKSGQEEISVENALYCVKCQKEYKEQ